MGSFTEEGYLREKARSLRAGLLSRLDEYVEEFPKGQSTDLIQTIHFFLGEIEKEIDACDDRRTLRLFCPLIEKLSEVLEWLDHAHTAQTPRACVELLCEIARRLHGDADVLVTPTVESNYQILDEVPWLTRLTDSLSASRQQLVIDQFPRALYHVRFPRVERENILNHALFGQEFGHSIADEFFYDHEDKVHYQEQLNAAQAEVEHDPEIKSELAECSDETERADLINRIQDKLSTIHQRGLVELMSDAIAVHLFGPSAIFATVDLLIREPLDELPSEDDDYYPPTRYRWRLMFDVLEQSGYIDALRALEFTADQRDIADALASTLSYIEEAISKRSDRDVLQDDIYTRASYNWLQDKTLPEALDHAEKRVSEARYDPSLITTEVLPLIQRLEVGVPPSETGTWPKVSRVDWRSTIVAGWLVALGQATSGKFDERQRRDALSTTHRLTVKGVEYLFLQRDIEHYKSRLTSDSSKVAK
jgi:hypothetical protein